MRVLVLWSDDQSANLGVRVLAEGTAALAVLAWGDVTIVNQDFAPNVEGFSFSRATVLADMFRWGGPVKKFLMSFDVVLDTGAGDSFTDIYGLKRLTIMTYVQWTAQRLGIPIVQTPQTIGPFESVVGRRVARRTMERMSAVISRDSESTDYAASLRQRVAATSTDVVFALPVPEVVKSRDVILNVSGLIWVPNKHVDHAAYQKDIERLVHELQGAGRHVTLLAHVLENPSSDNDVNALDELTNRLGLDIEKIIPADLNAARQILASARLVIGSRMHACLNAISSGTPAIPWAYSRKFAPLMNDIGWDAVVDLRSEPDPVKATMDLIAQNSEESLREKVSLALSRTHDRLDLAVLALRRLSPEVEHGQGI